MLEQLQGCVRIREPSSAVGQRMLVYRPKYARRVSLKGLEVFAEADLCSVSRQLTMLDKLVLVERMQPRPAGAAPNLAEIPHYQSHLPSATARVPPASFRTAAPPRPPRCQNPPPQTPHTGPAQLA